MISELGRADQALGKTGNNFTAAAKMAGAFGTAALAAGTAVFAMVKSVADAADQLGKLSQKVGVSVESLSALKYAAELSDLSLDQLGTGLKQLSKNMQEAQLGSAEVREAFRALNVQFQDAGKLRMTEAVLMDLSARFSELKDSPAKTALAMRIFGKAGADLIPFLNLGRDGIAKLTEEAKKFGVVISTESAKQAEEFNDNLKRLKASSEGLAISLAGPLVKALGEATAEMVKAKKEGEGFFGTMIRGWQNLALGDDEMQVSKQIVEATDAVMNAEKALENAQAQFAQNQTPFDADQVKRFTGEVKAAKEELDRLFKVRDVLAPGPETKPGEKPKQKKDAPALRNPAEEERTSKAIQEGIEEEQKVQAEAIAATVAFRDNELAIDKAFYENSNKALIDFYELEQEMAIAQGQILVDEEGSHSSKVMELRTSLQSQSVALENESFARRLEQLQGFSDAELDEMGGRQSILEQMEKDHTDALARIRDQEQERDKQRRRSGLQGAEQAMNDLSGLMNTQSRKVFELGKAASLGQAAYKGALAVMDAWEAGMSTGGPWAPFVAAGYAAAAAANALNLMNNIRNQTFGGGGGAPTPPGQGASGIGSQGTAPAAPVQRGPDTIIHLHGDTFGRKQVRALADQFNENTRDGGRVVFA